MQENKSNELISAEIVFSQQNDLSRITTPNSEYRRELSVITEKLEKYANHADRYDYMVAVAGGILCGTFDAQTADVISRILKAADFDFEGKGRKILGNLAESVEGDRDKTSISGLFCNILGSCMNKNIKGIHVTNRETGQEEFSLSKGVVVIGGTVINSFLTWLAAERKPEEIDKSDFPETIKKILHEVNNRQNVRKFLKNPHIPEINQKNLEKWGVPAIFISLVESHLADVNKSMRKVKSFPKNTIHGWTEKFPTIRLDSEFLEKTGNQILSVLANEIIVRGFYFIRHLMMEMDSCGDIELVDWNKVIPFDNRTVTRMMSVASLTFTAADMSTAAVRAALESGGNAAVFAAKYAVNINVVGVGRAIIAVTKDVSMEWEEADLIRERRILTEKINAEQVEAILSYRKQMEAVVEEYLAEDLQAFLTGADEIEDGLSSNDSDKVIHGNVTIQKIMGRKPQFTNQDEFDTLMDSMDDLVL